MITGVISHDNVHVPLYLSNLRLSLVTAIKGQPLQKWTIYQQEITNACKHFHYDAAFGNPGKFGLILYSMLVQLGSLIIMTYRILRNKLTP